MRRALLRGFAFVAGAALAFTAFAQGAPEAIDLEAIRARAAAHAADAEALAATVKARGAALTETARDTATQAESNGRAYSQAVKDAARPRSGDTFDFDRLIADAGAVAAQDLGSAPRFIAFASTSLPSASLAALLRDVQRAGGVVVFRGLPGGSVAGLTAALRQALEPGEQLDGVGIDPRLFRAFGIAAVPTYVMTGSDFELCDGFDCNSAVPPHDRISGNVTARYALDTFAGGGGPGAKIAALHLARLQGNQP